MFGSRTARTLRDRPSLGDGDEQPVEETIAPTAFRRAAETSQAAVEVDKHNTLRTVIGLVLLFLVTASFLLVYVQVGQVRGQSR